MREPGEALTSVLRRLATETGLSISVIHPGDLSADEVGTALSGLDDAAMEALLEGQPSVSLETDPVIRSVDREIARSVVAPLAHRGCWAAFFDPDGTVAVVGAHGGAEA